MRPHGEIRRALRDAVARLAAGGGAVNFRQAAAAAQVGASVAQVTLDNMARAGEVAVVGREKPAGSCHWHRLYAPVGDGADEPAQAWAGSAALAEVMHLFQAHT